MSSVEHSAPAPDLRSEFAQRFHKPLVRFFARRIHDRAEAEDLAQEVLLRVIGVHELERIEHREAFVFKIAVNLLRDRRRGAFRARSTVMVPIDHRVSDELESELVEDLSPERVLLSRDNLADALRALDELGERTRNIFILFRLENMKQKDIAALYGIGRSTVEKHVMKAVLHLATRFGRP